MKKCDVVLPLVAIATPATYVKEPLKVFGLDFEENLEVVRLCVKYNKRLIFPSTSEVYGMCPDEEFKEDESPLVVGPINKQRWIYSVSKQLLDRVIWAYGFQKGLRFTLFRPFNWIGPKLDDLAMEPEKEGSSRVVTQFISNLIQGEAIRLVDGGEQKRCFTYVDDGIDGLMRVIENKNDVCNGEIFNIGKPKERGDDQGACLQAPGHLHELPRARRGEEDPRDRRGLFRRLLWQGVSGHKPQGPFHQKSQRNPRVGAKGGPRHGTQPDYRILP